jgi:hypothetical protein
LISIKYSLLVIVVVALAACGTPPAGDATGGRHTPMPSAVTALIHELESQPVANPPAYVARYDYAGRVVYYVPPRCCDIFGNLYDAAGQIICHPDGGLAGRGDGRCPDFFSRRSNEIIIWRDPRARA